MTSVRLGIGVLPVKVYLDDPYFFLLKFVRTHSGMKNMPVTLGLDDEKYSKIKDISLLYDPKIV